MVFDHYDIIISLKQQTRERRMTNKQQSKGESYIFTDATPIRTTLKHVLANVKTKDSLTDSLSKTILQHCKTHNSEVVVSTQRGTLSNHRNVDHLFST